MSPADPRSRPGHLFLQRPRPAQRLAWGDVARRPGVSRQSDAPGRIDERPQQRRRLRLQRAAVESWSARCAVEHVRRRPADAARVCPLRRKNGSFRKFPWERGRADLVPRRKETRRRSCTAVSPAQAVLTWGRGCARTVRNGHSTSGRTDPFRPQWLHPTHHVALLHPVCTRVQALRIDQSVPQE